MSTPHVVLGAAGGLGSTLVEHLTAAGEEVVAVVRDAPAARAVLPESVTVLAADATSVESLRSVMPDAATAVHFCVGAAYHRWRRFLPAAVRAAMAAAQACEAVLVFPDNTYTLGPIRTDPVDETHPREPTPIVGAPRIAAVASLLAAHREGDVRVVIPRFGSFYGPRIRNRFAAGLFQAAVEGGSPRWLGDLDAPHEMNVAGDVAAVMAHLAVTERAWGEEWHVPGEDAVTGRDFIGLIAEVAGRDLQPRTMSRRQAQLIGLVVPLVRALAETIAQFEVPMRLDGAKYTDAFGPPPCTSHRDAVAETYEWHARRN